MPTKTTDEIRQYVYDGNGMDAYYQVLATCAVADAIDRQTAIIAEFAEKVLHESGFGLVAYTREGL
jgi:hypothetical protein